LHEKQIVNLICNTCDQHDYLLLCFENSPIDLSLAQDQAVKFYYGGKKKKIKRLTYFFELRRILKKHRPDLVHQIGVSGLELTGVVLKGFPFIGYIVSLNRFLHQKYQFSLYRFAYTRIDTLCSDGKMLRGNHIDCLPLGPKNIVRIKRKEIKISCPKRKSEGLMIGLQVPSGRDFRPFFDILRSLLYQIRQSERLPEQVFSFKLYLENFQKTAPEYKALEEMIQAYGWEDSRVGVTLAWSELPLADIWLEVSQGTELSEGAYLCFLNASSGLFPRSSLISGLFSDGSADEHFYHPGDLRDIRGKLLNLAENFDQNSTQIELLTHDFGQSHILELHKRCIGKRRKLYHLARS